MAFLIHHIPNKELYLNTQLWIVRRQIDDATYRKHLRVVMAILLATAYDEANPPVGISAELFDVLTSERFHECGYNKTTDNRLWFCSYIGFEKITSAWAKEKYPKCKGYLCMRVLIKNHLHQETSHTVQIYF